MANKHHCSKGPRALGGAKYQKHTLHVVMNEGPSHERHHSLTANKTQLNPPSKYTPLTSPILRAPKGLKMCDAPDGWRHWYFNLGNYVSMKYWSETRLTVRHPPIPYIQSRHRATSPKIRLDRQEVHVLPKQAKNKRANAMLVGARDGWLQLLRTTKTHLFTNPIICFS